MDKDLIKSPEKASGKRRPIQKMMKKNNQKKHMIGQTSCHIQSGVIRIFSCKLSRVATA